MKMWSWIAAAFVVLVLQTTSLGCFGGNLFFDLPLLFIYSVGLFYGARAGLVCGLVFGLLQDVSSPAVFGFYMLTRGLVGYGTGSIKEMIFKNNYGYHVLYMPCRYSGWPDSGKRRFSCICRIHCCIAWEICCWYCLSHVSCWPCTVGWPRTT